METAQAQTSVKLVSNTGQTLFAQTNLDNRHQAFTTGSNAGGYVLTRLDLVVGSPQSAPAYSVSIHENASGSPGTSLGTLTNPRSLSSSWRLEQFTAPGSGIVLAANTTYRVKTTGTQAGIQLTRSGGEDPGGSAGWSIADGSSVGSGSFRMAIYGYAALGADAGDDVTVRTGARVTLGRTSSPGTLTYAWTQTGGPKVDTGRRDLGDARRSSRRRCAARPP